MKRNQCFVILFAVLCVWFSVNMFSADMYVETQPVMTSNTTPSGTAAASSIYSSYYEAWRAFDGEDASESWSRWISGYNFPQWISYSYPAPKYITHYYLLPEYAASTRDRSPKDWQFQGWNGSTWVTLDTRTNIRINNEWDYRGLYFQVASPGTYQSYRLYVTAVNGSDVVSIRKFRLLELNVGMSVYISGPSKGNNSGTYTWCANVSGSSTPPYTYDWRYSYDGVDYNKYFGTTQCVTAQLPIDSDLYLKVTVTDQAGETAVDYHFVINLDAEPIP